jgi:hypothetical protein
LNWLGWSVADTVNRFLEKNQYHKSILKANLDFLGREFSLFDVANDFWKAGAHSSWTEEIALAAVARNHNVVSSSEAFFLRITLICKLLEGR